MGDIGHEVLPDLLQPLQVADVVEYRHHPQQFLLVEQGDPVGEEHPLPDAGDHDLLPVFGSLPRHHAITVIKSGMPGDLDEGPPHHAARHPEHLAEGRIDQGDGAGAIGHHEPFPHAAQDGVQSPLFPFQLFHLGFDPGGHVVHHRGHFTQFIGAAHRQPPPEIAPADLQWRCRQ